MGHSQATQKVSSLKHGAMSIVKTTADSFRLSRKLMKFADHQRHVCSWRRLRSQSVTIWMAAPRPQPAFQAKAMVKMSGAHQEAEELGEGRLSSLPALLPVGLLDPVLHEAEGRLHLNLFHFLQICYILHLFNHIHLHQIVHLFHLLHVLKLSSTCSTSSYLLNPFNIRHLPQISHPLLKSVFKSHSHGKEEKKKISTLTLLHVGTS